MSNLDLWNKLGKTDPKHTKPFKRAGGFKGTAIKPIYTTQKMTEEFGPAGKGWGMGEPSFQIVPGNNGEVMVYCTVSLWWIEPNSTDGTVNTVYGVGGDKVVSYLRANDEYNRPERWENDDEAFKKAFTDATGNAMKHLGMSADVHMGRFDDSKYVREVTEELGEQRGDAPTPPAGAKPMKQADKRLLWGILRDELNACQTADALMSLWNSKPFIAETHNLKEGDWDLLVEHKNMLREDFDKRNIPAAGVDPRAQFDAMLEREPTKDERGLIA